MKVLALNISNCRQCPFCRHDKLLYSFVCHATKDLFSLSSEKAEEIVIPKECPLPDRETIVKLIDQQ